MVDVTKLLVRRPMVDDINLADAKARLSELVAQAENGACILISRRGTPVAQLSAIARPRKPIALSMLRSVTDTLPRTADSIVRTMRDEARY
jgi:prevent-host-death family protein